MSNPNKAKFHKGFSCGTRLFLLSEDRVTIIEEERTTYSHVMIVTRSDFDEMVEWYLEQKKEAGGTIV